MPHTDLPERFNWIDIIYVGENDPKPVRVESVRLHKRWALLKLAGYDSREDAEMLRGRQLQIPRDQAIPLEEGEYFLFELLGLAVETENGSRLGPLVEVIETGANNVFVVRGDQGDILIPDIAEVIIDIDFDHGRMIISPLPGMLSA